MNMQTWFKRVFSSLSKTFREKKERRMIRRMQKECDNERKLNILHDSMGLSGIPDTEEKYRRMIDLCAKYKIDLPISN